MNQRRIDTYYVIFPPKENIFFSIVFDAFDSIKGAVTVVFLVFALVFRAVGVSGDSMVPTLQDSDWLAIKSINTQFERGDIVVVTQPWERDIPIIKRVIAKEGDTIYIDLEKHEVFVNGELLDEPYIAEPTSVNYNAIFPLTVPEGHLFVMGDNRNSSLDSRSGKVGLIDERYVLGKAVYRISPNSGSLTKENKNEESK